jgi:hypothetical protein
MPIQTGKSRKTEKKKKLLGSRLEIIKSWERGITCQIMTEISCPNGKEKKVKQ